MDTLWVSINNHFKTETFVSILNNFSDISPSGYIFEEPLYAKHPLGIRTLQPETNSFELNNFLNNILSLSLFTVITLWRGYYKGAFT